jgi:hypothetical protein
MYLEICFNGDMMVDGKFNIAEWAGKNLFKLFEIFWAVMRVNGIMVGTEVEGTVFTFNG